MTRVCIYRDMYRCMYGWMDHPMMIMASVVSASEHRLRIKQVEVDGRMKQINRLPSVHRTLLLDLIPWAYTPR